MYQIPREDLCMSDPMPFSQHWEARVPIPLKEIEDMGAAMQMIYSSLKAGDSITVCAFDGRAWKNVTEVATYRVTSTENKRVAVVRVGATANVPVPKKEDKALPGEPLLVIPVGKTFEVRDEKGNTLEVFVDRKQADDFARREGTRRAAVTVAA